jgi:hypothetical protein
VTRACWAESLGGCAGGPSGEHHISASQFTGAKTIAIQGLSWCRDKTIEVGLNSLVAKHLCRGHNTSLSPVDAEAMRFKHALRDFHLGTLRDSVRIDGGLVERWLLKTAINLHLADKSPALQVTPPFVEMAFGQRATPKGQGMFVVGHLGQQLAFADGQITFTTLQGVYSKQVAIAQFGFHGWTLVYAFAGAAPVDGAMRFGRAAGKHDVVIEWPTEHAHDRIPASPRLAKQAGVHHAASARGPRPASSGSRRTVEGSRWPPQRTECEFSPSWIHLGPEFSASWSQVIFRVMEADRARTVRPGPAGRRGMEAAMAS